MIIPTSVATYHRSDLQQVRLVNMFAESAEAVPGKVVLFPRPGMVEIANLSDQPIDGLFQQPGFLDGSRFTVSGDLLYRDEINAGTLGGIGRTQMVAADALLINRSGNLYRFNGAIATVTFPDDALVSSIAYLGGYSIASRQGSRRFYFTLDSTTWDGLDYLSTEQSNDPIVGIAVVIDQLWIFCERHTEIFFLTGDPDAPFQRVQGRVFDKGAWSRDTIVNLDNTVQWLGDDGIVYRAENSPIRVSDHGIEDEVSKTFNASAFTYTWKGHLFYGLRLDETTLVLDIATGPARLWHSVETFGFPVWNVSFVIQSGQDVVVGDSTTGKLWKLTDAAYYDGDTIMSRIFTILLDDRGFVDNLYIDCAVRELVSPETPSGKIEIRTSRDDGATWGDWRQNTLGLQGQKRKQSARFNRLGIVDRSAMTIQVRLTDPVIAAVNNVRINETGAGRSR